MKALIIAAGRGNRLRIDDEDSPKPLFKVAGLPLIERAILSAKKAGILDFVVVTGFKGDEVQKTLERHRERLGVTIEFVDNPQWEKANGHSVLAAKSLLQDNFILLMSDHVFEWNILHDLQSNPPSEGGVILAVDDRIDEIFDLEDATKVKTREGRIVQIGKDLQDYDAVDTGIFYCSPDLFGALERVCSEGKGSLSEAIALLAVQGKARTFRIGKRFWQDVDTPTTLKEAHRVLFNSVKKDTDGFTSRHINRRVSGWITQWLVRMPLTPNQVTWSALVVGLLSGLLVSRGTYWNIVLGGILFKFASIYDGCDGEVAKIKLASSKFGEWLDTICDNITYVAFLYGVVIGASRQGFVYAVPFGILIAIGIGISLSCMYFYLVRFTNSGSLVTVQKELQNDLSAAGQNPLVRLASRLGFTMKRDFFALAFLFFCLADRLEWILILSAIGTNLTWFVMLTKKREFAAAETEISEKSRI